MKILPWIDWCFRHVRTVLLILALIMVSGAITYHNVPKESTPDIKSPLIYVSAMYDGISPYDAERLILRPLEQRLRSIEGVKSMSATGFEGGGNIILEFLAGSNVDKASQRVREKVDEAKADMPKDMRDPTVTEINLSLMPVLIVMLSGEVSDRMLFKEAERLKDAIEGQVPAVLEARVVGNRSEQVEITISPEKLEAYKISMDQVIANFMRNHIMISAGRLNNPSGTFTMRVPGLLESGQDILMMPIISERDAAIKLQDIAHVRKNFKDPESLARNNGVKTVSLEISKRTGENVINTIQAVRKVISNEQKRWPPTLQVTFSNDDSQRILDMVKDLKNHLITAVILVMIIVVLSLGLRSTILVGVAIPGSFLMGILIIGLMGFTMNMIVLFGLILSVGMLVDGAIIVVEYADRKMAEGFDKRQAYAMASERMLWPVITSITTILVVFLPLVFWPGVVGEFMKYLPYTLLATLTASLVMALIFIPTLGSLFGKLSQKHKSAIEMVLLSETGDLSKLQGLPAVYYRALTKVLGAPKMVVGAAVSLLILSVIAYGQLGKGVEFFPDVDPDQAVVIIRNPGNTSIEQKDAIVRQVEERVLKIPDFTCVYTTTVQSSTDSRAAEDTIGRINVEFDNWQNRRKAKVVLADLENQLQDIPGVAIEVQKEQSGPGGSKPIVIELSCSDHAVLKKEFLRLKGFVGSLQGVTGIEDNLPTPGITWEFVVNRAEAARLGADIATIGNAIKLATNGIVITKYRPNESREEVDIVVRYDAKNRSLNSLDRLKVQTAQGLVPISVFVKKEAHQRLNMIHRVDGNRVLTLKADVKSGYLVHDAVQSIKGWVDENLAGGSVSVNYKGEEADKGETSSFLAMAFSAAIFMMAVILVTQFNSFFSMMLVLSSIVMSTIGVFIGLIVMRVPFSIVMCGIGVIALAGIIVSNNIILIDTFDQLSKQFSNKKEAILRTGVQRLRPVILTKLTAILGLLPIMFRIDIDYISMSVHMGSPATMWWQQIAISIVFGVAFASFLTLFVTPSALMIRENMRLKRQNSGKNRS